MSHYKRLTCDWCNGSGMLFHHYSYEYGKDIYETCPYCQGAGYNDILVSDDAPW